MRSRMGAFTPLASLVGVVLVVALALFVSSGLSGPLDATIIGAVRAPELIGPFAPLRQVTELGSTLAVIVVATLTAALAAAIGPWRHGLIGAAIIAAASFLNGAIKLAIARERPALLEPLVQEHGFSFPSGHSALGMVAYGILAVVIGRSRLPRPLRAGLIGALLVLVLLIGLSRVWLGVHYPTDVLAGWTAGAVIVLLYRSMTRTVPREPAAAAVDAPQDDAASPV